MGLQEEAEGIARALSFQVSHMRTANRASWDTVCTVMVPHNSDMEPQLRLAALLVLDLDPNIEFDWSLWP